MQNCRRQTVRKATFANATFLTAKILLCAREGTVCRWVTRWIPSVLVPDAWLVRLILNPWRIQRMRILLHACDTPSPGCSSTAQAALTQPPASVVPSHRHGRCPEHLHLASAAPAGGSHPTVRAAARSVIAEHSGARLAARTLWPPPPRPGWIDLLSHVPTRVLRM